MDESIHAGHRERMRERFRQSGSEDFATHELLEMLLYSGIPRKDTNPLAHRLLATFGSLRNVLCASEEALLSVEGMTPSAVSLLQVSCAVMRRALTEHAQGETIGTTSQMCAYAAAQLTGYAVEKLLCIALDAQGKVLSSAILSTGTSSLVMVPVQQVANFAIVHRAHALIIAHNHPAGNLKPSHADVELTESVLRAMTGIGIEFIDHVIVSDDAAYCVLRERTVALHPADALTV